ncbi:hypothetical protein J6590_029514 [Homalodisca vitripennis]|nr:hypothetical protein J6590_029514 [Homalodisca vitripennis]
MTNQVTIAGSSTIAALNVREHSNSYRKLAVTRATPPEVTDITDETCGMTNQVTIAGSSTIAALNVREHSNSYRKLAVTRATPPEVTGTNISVWLGSH